MIKRRSNRTLFLRGGLLCAFLLTATVPGCKKKEPPPPPPQATPLPQKAVPAGQASAQGVKPVLGAPSSAKKPAAAMPVQGQTTSAKRLAPPQGVSLDFTSRRDPFKPYAQVLLPQQGAAKRVSGGRVKDPLPIQKFDTEKFRISGIVTGLKENSALVIDPNNKGYVVKEGMLIGNNDGTVKKITGNTVEVEESFRDDNGRVRKRVIKLMLLRKK